MKIGIIIGSIRDGRFGERVGEWVTEFARQREGVDYEVLDLKAFDVPLLTSATVPGAAKKQYDDERVTAWSKAVDACDGFVFVTPEYNHVAPPSLINALDYLVQEWAYKPASFVSYGGVSAGLRAVQAVKPMLTALRMMPIPEAVSIPFFSQYVDREARTFDPGEVQAKAAVTMLDELHKWAAALRTLRS